MSWQPNLPGISAPSADIGARSGVKEVVARGFVVCWNVIGVMRLGVVLRRTRLNYRRSLHHSCWRALGCFFCMCCVQAKRLHEADNNMIPILGHFGHIYLTVKVTIGLQLARLAGRIKIYSFHRLMGYHHSLGYIITETQSSLPFAYYSYSLPPVSNPCC
jgi:hypothetical protein